MEIEGERRTYNSGPTDALAGAAMVTASVEALASLIKELLRAGMSNPTIGIVASFLSGAVAYKAGLITTAEWSTLKVALYALAGVSVTVDLISALESALDLSKAVQAPTAPSGNVLVFGDTGTSPQLNALLAKLAQKG